MAKLPSFQFYPGDWLRDGVAGCSLEAQGLWLRMLIVMHDSEAYGYLVINGSAMDSAMVARRCGCSLKQYEAVLAELDDAGVPSRTETGVIYSRRMVQDAENRAKNAQRQRNFKAKKRGNGSGNASVTDKSQHSSSSTSVTTLSSSNEKERGGGGGSRNGQPPTAAANSPPVSLTKSEEKMTDEEFLEHLQELYPQHNAALVFQKLKDFCRRPDVLIKPTRRRLKEWLETEEDEFSPDLNDSGGSDEKARREAIAKCPLCDQKGYLKDGAGSVKICKHLQTEKAAKI